MGKKLSAFRGWPRFSEPGLAIPLGPECSGPPLPAESVPHLATTRMGILDPKAPERILGPANLGY